MNGLLLMIVALSVGSESSQPSESCGMRISSLEDISPLDPARASRARLRLLYLIQPSFL